MSGVGRDPLNAGVAGGPASDLPAGSAEVHSHITHGGEAGIGGTQGGRGGVGGGEQNVAERGMERAREMADQAGERVREVADEAGERARELGGRASETASRARHRAAEALDQAEDVIEERTGLISTIRQNPLPALGIAFGLGFMLAGSDSGSRGRKGSGRKGSGSIDKAMTQAKTAIISAISTAAAQQVRSMLSSLQQGGQGGSTQTSGARGTSAGSGPARH
ncbi:MAG TPA: hypothetical protein VGR27_14250 [Longimicrobiaceae bacterium]|nr:hypothetical protein [Longimicrobiaceae bacterium]